MLQVGYDMQVLIRHVQIKQVLIKSNIICHSLKSTLKSLLCDGVHKFKNHTYITRIALK